MNFTTIEEAENGAAYLLNQLECFGDIELKCNDGSVTVRTSGDFTYTGKFGQTVCRSMIKNNPSTFAEKLYIVSVYMDMYSGNFGGFNILPA